MAYGDKLEKLKEDGCYKLIATKIQEQMNKLLRQELKTYIIRLYMF